MSTTQPPHDFKKLNGKVYWSARTIKGADYDSFEPLNLIWARDKHRIYSYDLPLRGADRNSFTVLNALFAKDNDRVYFLSGCIREANPATFHALDAGCFVALRQLSNRRYHGSLGIERVGQQGYSWAIQLPGTEQV